MAKSTIVLFLCGVAIAIGLAAWQYSLAPQGTLLYTPAPGVKPNYTPSSSVGSEDELSRLELWIKVIWKDEAAKPRDGTTNFEMMRSHRTYDYALGYATSGQRGSETIRRFESDLQSRMWSSVLKIE